MAAGARQLSAAFRMFLEVLVVIGLGGFDPHMVFVKQKDCLC